MAQSTDCTSPPHHTMDGRPTAGPGVLKMRLGQNTLSLRGLLHLPAHINHQHRACLATQPMETSVLSSPLHAFSTGSRMATTHLSLPMPIPTGLSIFLKKRFISASFLGETGLEKIKTRKQHISYIVSKVLARVCALVVTLTLDFDLGHPRNPGVQLLMTGLYTPDHSAHPQDTERGQQSDKKAVHHSAPEMYACSPLRQNFLYPEKSEEAPRVRSSSTGRLFLTSMQQTLLQARRFKETHENAPTCSGST